MKILKFSGIVVGIHLLALILIFANPGCSSSTKPAPSAADTITAAPPPITVPGTSGSGSSGAGASASGSTPAIAFNPDISALNAGVRYSPTRPGTPAASTLQGEPVGNVTPATTYTVASGDSLWSIAHKNHLTTGELAAANNLNVKSNPKLKLGQKLIIPGKGVPAAKTNELAAATPSGAASPATPPAAKPSSDALKHVVRPGETLGAIARQYGVKQGEIAVANNISDPQKIRAGMELSIPGGWQTPSGKSAKSDKSAAGNAATKRNADSAATTTSTPEYADPTPPAPPAAEVPVIQIEEVPAAPRQP